jgi:adenylylsulfate kinase
MYIETHTRAMVKAISYRIFGSLITAIIIYIFVGNIEFAIAGGIADALAKIGAFYVHERAWNRIKLGRKQIEPFNLWFTGLPMSGKTTLANAVYEALKKHDIPIERIDSKDIRDLLPNAGFSREERHEHLTRVGHLIKTLQNNSVSTIASFVSPYTESREQIRQMTQNYVEVYVNTDLATCQARDYKGVYARALSGDLPNLTGVGDVYEIPQAPHLTVDTTQETVEEATDRIVAYLKKQYLP